jgi:hypothetical protein
MSKANYIEKLPEITAISKDDVKKPNMPVGEAVQEAENLTAWAKEDKAVLTKAGLDWVLVDDLPIRAGACRYAQSVWARESKSREDAQKEWNAKSPEAFALRDELLHDSTFAYRKLPDLLNKVQAIREGGSNADMLQDLSDLSVLGKDNKALLKAIGMDLGRLDQAAQMADDLSVVLANANGEAGDDDDAKEMRDRAYTYMKMAVDEIRATGQYAFWRDEDWRKGYVSSYQRRLNKRRKREDDSAKNDDRSHE